MRKAPDYIQFYPTLRCNRSCEFCFNKNMPSMSDMPLENFCSMLSRLLSIGVKTIDIIGGEPTLHPDIMAMILEAERVGFPVNISSNGTNLSILARVIDKTGRTTIGISLNDRNEFECTKEFIARYHPVVKSVFHADMDPGMIRDILALRPKHFYLLYRDAIRKSELGQTVPFERFLLTVRERFCSDGVGTVFCSGFLADVDAHPELARVRCPAGTTKLGVMPDGSVYPCNLFFGRPEFRLGNILTDPFDTIWSNRLLDFFRTFARNTCPQGSCSLHDTCHGGCPAHSLVHFGSLSEQEPRCTTTTRISLPKI